MELMKLHAVIIIRRPYIV